jgi:hypothetical protein
LLFIFQGSKILSQVQSISLQNLIKFSTTTQFSLIYQASRDGFTLNNFHTICDSISNTLMIIKTSYTNNVFGFFTTKNWDGTSGLWQYDKDAFLFSFINQFDVAFKMNVSNPEYALRVYPTELNIGYELLINDEFNMNLNYGWTSGPGQSYQLPEFVNNSGYLLISNQSSSFYVSELEVYQVDACWSSPCLNNGECQKTIENKYECTCTLNYFGIACQYQPGLKKSED